MTNYNKIAKAQNIVESKPETAEDKLNKPVYGVVANCGRLNLRESPSKESTALRVLEVNTKVQILDEVDEWYNVCTVDGIEGYVVRDFIKCS